jgi:hypothetical protein
MENNPIEENFEIPKEFLRVKCKTSNVPDSEPSSIIFLYDFEQKFYVLSSVSALSHLRSLLSSSSVSVSLVIKFLKKLKSAQHSGSTRDSNYTNNNYIHSMRLLWAVVLLFLVFFIMIILKTYYYPDFSAEFVATPFAVVGLVLNCAVIMSNGRCKIRLCARKTVCEVPSAFVRHEISMILNKYNKKMILYGIEWKLGTEGRWVELRVKRVRVTEKSLKRVSIMQVPQA